MDWYSLRMNIDGPDNRTSSAAGLSNELARERNREAAALLMMLGIRGS